MVSWVSSQIPLAKRGDFFATYGKSYIDWLKQDDSVIQKASLPIGDAEAKNQRPASSNSLDSQLGQLGQLGQQGDKREAAENKKKEEVEPTLEEDEASEGPSEGTLETIDNDVKDILANAALKKKTDDEKAEKANEKMKKEGEALELKIAHAPAEQAS